MRRAWAIRAWIADEDVPWCGEPGAPHFQWKLTNRDSVQGATANRQRSHPSPQASLDGAPPVFLSKSIDLGSLKLLCPQSAAVLSFKGYCPLEKYVGRYETKF